MSDSYRLGWPPGPRPDASEPAAVPCTRCGHRADSHLHPGSCSVRGRWWRRCRCSGYTRLRFGRFSPRWYGRRYRDPEAATLTADDRLILVSSQRPAAHPAC